MSRYVVASAIVAPTAIHRGMLVATFWFINPKTPVEVFGDRPAAMQLGQRSGAKRWLERVGEVRH